jgi:hypothetical protein
MLLLVVVAACSDSNSNSNESIDACDPQEPERVVASPLDVDDLSVPVPEATMDMNGDGTADAVQAEGGRVTVDDLVLTTSASNGVSIRAWADLDGDGDDDLLVDDGSLGLIEGGRWHGEQDIHRAGRGVPDNLTSVWPGNLDASPGGDFYVVRRQDGHTKTVVYSGYARLAGYPASPSRTLLGAPRALADLGGPFLETVLLDPGPPSTITFSNRTRPHLVADLGESHRVTWVRVFNERGVQKVALQTDRKVAVWPVPAPCP